MRIGGKLGQEIKDWTLYRIREELERAKGNKTHAAAALGISLRNLRYWINRERALEKWKKPKPGFSRIRRWMRSRVMEAVAR